MLDAPSRRKSSPATLGVYFTEGYGSADATMMGTEWIRLTDHGQRILLPLQIRRSSNGIVEASSPYGYSGIHVPSSVSDQELLVFWGEAKTKLEELGVVSLFLRFAPFDVPSANRCSKVLDLDIRAVSRTVCVQTAAETVIWNAMEGRARTAIRKANNNGLHGRVRSISSKDVETGGSFRSLYEKTMHRIGAAGRYFFDTAYYIRLISGLGDRLKVAEVTDMDDRVVASSLVMVDEDIAHYHLAGSHAEAAKLGANNLLIWSILRWNAACGRRAVHLGGGISGEDGLFKFKKSFGGTASPYCVGKVIIDSEQYGLLVAQAADRLGVTNDILIDSNYFPAYNAMTEAE